VAAAVAAVRTEALNGEVPFCVDELVDIGRLLGVSVISILGAD
jgi:hypothetical protein